MKHIPTYAIPKEAIEFTNHVQRLYDGKIISILLYGSSSTNDIKKHGDIDLIVLFDSAEKQKTVLRLGSCYSSFINEQSNPSKFRHPPLLLFNDGVCLFGPIRSLGVLSNYTLLYGDEECIIKILRKNSHKTGDSSLNTHIIWTLFELVKDYVETIIEADLNSENKTDRLEYWKRINNRLIDYLFFGFRMISYVKANKWLFKNSEVVNTVNTEYGITIEMNRLIKEKKEPNFIYSSLIIKTLDVFIREVTLLTNNYLR